MIKLAKYEDGFEGAHGRYVKLSPSLGIKVIHSPLFKSIAKAYKSHAYRQAKKEAELLTSAFESGVVPRCYGVTLVKIGNRFKVGVLMQHLGSTPISESDFYDQVSEAYDEINDSLMELGIYHNDLHEDNIMVYRGKFYAVDFSPKCVETD
jgi:RIO-like serine/threonine protein kinase